MERELNKTLATIPAWETSDIWLRGRFEWSGTSPSRAALVIFHDEDTEVRDWTAGCCGK